MVLKTASQVCELNCINGSRNTTVLIGMYFLFTGVHQHAVAVDVPLIVQWLVWLPAIVESDWVRPDVLPALPNLLTVVLPVDTMPEEVIVDPVFEAGPNCCTCISSRSIDHDRARRGSSTVVDPI